MTTLNDAASKGRKTDAGGRVEDAELLRRFATERSEAAFAEIVRRHLSPVYAFALRRVGGDAHLAEDVAQVVFTTLARKAASLTARQVLGGWLCRAAHFAARDVVRAERRRRVREQEAIIMDEILGDEAAAKIDWEKLHPLLAQTMGELNDDDRDAVWLRFFEGRSFAEVGARLRLTENTARMRVERALDKLHTALAKRGVTSTTAALGIALANQAAASTPAGMAANVTGAALAGAATGGGAWGALGLFMKKNLMLSGAVAVVAIGVVLVRSMAGGPADADNASAGGNGATAKAGESAPAMAQRKDAGVAVGGSGPTVSLPAAKPTLVDAPVPAGAMGPADAAAWAAINQKRAIMNNLRMLAAGRDAFLKFNGRLPASLDELVGPNKMVREMKPVAGEDYSTVRLGDPVLSVATADGTPVVLTVGAATPKGPPTMAESAAWERALKDYLQTRTASPEPQMPGVAVAGATGIELAGVFEAPDGVTFLLNDGSGGGPQKLKLGQRLGRYVLADYEAKNDTLTLRDGETTQRVKLREAKAVAPLAVETEVAYQLIREVQRREGWPVEAIRVQQPQRMGDGPWLVFANQMLERNEQRMVLGDRISATVSTEGRLLSYTNRGRAK